MNLKDEAMMDVNKALQLLRNGPALTGAERQQIASLIEDLRELARGATVVAVRADFDRLPGEGVGAWDQRATALFSLLQEQSDNLPPGEIVGGMLRFPRADSAAYYRVTKAKPLELEHLPFMDAWTVEESTLRGLTHENVSEMLEHRRHMSRLFRSAKA